MYTFKKRKWENSKQSVKVNLLSFEYFISNDTNSSIWKFISFINNEFVYFDVNLNFSKNYIPNTKTNGVVIIDKCCRIWYVFYKTKYIQKCLILLILCFDFRNAGFLLLFIWFNFFSVFVLWITMQSKVKFCCIVSFETCWTIKKKQRSNSPKIQSIFCIFKLLLFVSYLYL